MFKGITAMDAARDDYQLEQMGRDHRIGAEVFVPFAIMRLRGDSDITEATLTVRLRDISEAGLSHRTLRLWWSADSALAQPLGVSERTVTEWAAYGVACAVVSLYARLCVRQVAVDGDRFDYWVDDGAREYALEVSGTTVTDVETRHRDKIRQWRGNPYGVDGYVLVVGFATREVIFSFNRFEEEM
jgi:hypothetical protein